MYVKEETKTIKNAAVNIFSFVSNIIIKKS